MVFLYIYIFYFILNKAYVTNHCLQALRNMAFGPKRPPSSKQQKTPGSAGQQRHGNKPAKEEDWEEWRRRDTEVGCSCRFF